MSRGGGSEKGKDGELVLKEDIEDSNRAYEALTNSMREEIPIGFVIGNRNDICATRVPHRYNVLDFFRITDIWYDRRDGKTGARVRFEKVDLATKSWWAPSDMSDPLPLDQREPVLCEQQVCRTCSEASPRVYDEGWMCLRKSCKSFWSIDGSRPPTRLAYAPEFLAKRSRQTRPIRSPFSLVPDLLSTFSKEDLDVGSCRVAWKGIVCTQCKCCISRKLWRGWSCETEGCGFEFFPQVNPVSLRSVLPEVELGVAGHRLPFTPKSGGLPEIEYLRNYRKDTFRFPGSLVTHFVANTTVNRRFDGPDDLFRKLQQEDLGLKRHRLGSSVGKLISQFMDHPGRIFDRKLANLVPTQIVAGTLTSHFAVNYVRFSSH